MSYTLPPGDAADFSWVGDAAYTLPAGDAADFSWQEVVDPPGEGDPSSVEFSAVFDDDVTFSGVALYDNRNPRRASRTAAFVHEVGSLRSPETAARWGLSRMEPGGDVIGWGVARPSPADTSTGWDVSGRLDRMPGMPWGLGAAVHRDSVGPHANAEPVARVRVVPWGLGAGQETGAKFIHEAARSVLVQVVHIDQLPVGRVVLAGAPFRPAGRSGLVAAIPWALARLIMPGQSGWVPIEPGDPGDPPPPLATLYILPARYYMAVHSLTAHTLPDLTQFAIKDVSLSADAGSFGWSFGASGRLELFDLLAPSAGLPAQIRITLDGMQWAFIVDSLVEEERFGQRGVRIGGRSVTALVGAPYSREAARLNTSGMNAQQLAEAALEFTGVSLDWGIPDWLVPAGSWSHVGTPLAAVQAIVEASGGYLQSHRTLAQLQARHPYPDLPGGIPGGPWNWYGAFPADVELAPDSLVTRAIERKDGPDINAVYVSGTTAGPNAFYKRDGTAGEKRASPVTDPLITAEVVARMRGRSIVGAAGAKHMVRVDLPILTGPSQPGVLNVGQLVQVNTAQPWRARVRSVSASASFGAAPRQTVSLERHLETT